MRKVHIGAMWVIGMLFFAGCNSDTTGGGTTSCTLNYKATLELNTSHESNLTAQTATYYRFTTKSAGYYQLLLAGIDETVELNATLYDDCALTTKRIDANNSELNTSVVAVGALDESKNYVLALKSDTQTDLNLTVKALNEGNETIPVQLKLATNHAGFADKFVAEGKYHFSYYQFSVANDGTYTITAGNTTPTSRLILNVYDNWANAAIGTDNANNTNNKSITITLLANINYYIKVANRNDQSAVRYDLNVTQP